MLAKTYPRGKNEKLIRDRAGAETGKWQKETDIMFRQLDRAVIQGFYILY